MGPFGSNIKVDSFVDEGVPVLNGSNLEGFELTEKSFRYVTEEKADSLKKANAHKGDVVITHRGTLGQIVYIPQTAKKDRYVISQSQFRIKCNENVLPEYFVYYFHTPIGQRKLLSNASQVGVPALARPSSTFQKIKIELPDLETQKKVVKLIGSLQNRIKTNSEINDNLEQQLREIFAELFSEKIADVETYNHLPLGELVTSIDNRGKTPPLVTTPTEFPVIDVRALSGNSRIVDYTKCTKYVSAETYSSWFRSGHPKPKDILISTVGSLAEIKIFLGSKGCIAQNVVGFRVKNISAYYLYQYLSAIKNELVSYNIGSVQPSIKVTHIIKHPVYVPTKEEVETFDALAEKTTNIIYNNALESDCLANLRDTLLPKLISGEIDVSDIDL
ncbi:restriction endonuclease subunit S [Hydrogeniiclostridium mannosilyticum]|uniref:Restriction endonuclease subunit S n=2 Tax=Hydrogeniiclostridium mannosilyticum TaxID=2764322 RepID=A0A328UHD6_9FIRM|nr:restriction endonuclease subunit S [Hydrogeniiclostridium mannosilyticum]